MDLPAIVIILLIIFLVLLFSILTLLVGSLSVSLSTALVKILDLSVFNSGHTVTFKKIELKIFLRILSWLLSSSFICAILLYIYLNLDTVNLDIIDFSWSLIPLVLNGFYETVYAFSKDSKVWEYEIPLFIQFAPLDPGTSLRDSVHHQEYFLKYLQGISNDIAKKTELQTRVISYINSYFNGEKANHKEYKAFLNTLSLIVFSEHKQYYEEYICRELAKNIEKWDYENKAVMLQEIVHLRFPIQHFTNALHGFHGDVVSHPSSELIDLYRRLVEQIIVEPSYSPEYKTQIAKSFFFIFTDILGNNSTNYPENFITSLYENYGKLFGKIIEIVNIEDLEQGKRVLQQSKSRWPYAPVTEWIQVIEDLGGL